MSAHDRDRAAGRLEAIWLKRSKNGPMDSRQRAVARADRGLVDNANQGGHRQVTLIEAEKWRQISDELGVDVDPRARRANLLVSGVDLAGSRHRILRIGDCRIHLLGETRPCRKMEETVPGLQQALDPDWRGGAYGRVLTDGEVAVGDAVSWEGQRAESQAGRVPRRWRGVVDSDAEAS